MRESRLIAYLKKSNIRDSIAASIIAAFLLSVISFLASLLNSLFSNEGILVLLSRIAKFMIKGVEVPVIVFVFLTILFVVALSGVYKYNSYIVSWFLELFKWGKKKETSEVGEHGLHNTVLFNYRISSAFPGVRGLEWVYDKGRILKSLSIVLKEPLVFAHGDRNRGSSQPIWYFRGQSAFPVIKFQVLSVRKSKCLIFIKEFVIDRIAVFHGESYYKDFIYVETKADQSTGLYYKSEEDIRRCIQEFGYCYEEYAIFKKRIIPREHYDDGATIIRGKPVELVNPQLRARYLSKYNFFLAPHSTPMNDTNFNSIAEDYLNGILQGTHNVEDLFSLINKLPKKH